VIMSLLEWGGHNLWVMPRGGKSTEGRDTTDA
jgi:hypothetical protein